MPTVNIPTYIFQYLTLKLTFVIKTGTFFFQVKKKFGDIFVSKRFL